MTAPWHCIFSFYITRSLTWTTDNPSKTTS